MSEHTALIAGATGLVGKQLVSYLLTRDYYSRIKVLSRRQVDYNDPRVEVILVEDFDHLDQHKEQLRAEDYYCTLGTTIKKAGSREMFEKIDLVYPEKLAAMAKGFPEFSQFLMVTAAGANPSSPLFYNKVKGKVEKELRELELPALKIFRPSLLLGHRDERRWGEEVGKAISNILSFFMVGAKSGLFSIHARDVAKAMFGVASARKPGVEVFTASKMVKLAKAAEA